MDKRFISCCILLFLVGTTLQQDDGKNTTTTTAAPKDTTTKEPVTPICDICTCKDTKVDCNNRNLTKFFSVEQWNGLKDFKPKEVDLSDNSFVNVTVTALLPIEVLNLSNCDIEFIVQGAFKDLQSMRVLDLSRNKLTTAKLSPHAFEGRYSAEKYEPLNGMRVLSLAHNEFHSLNQDLFEHLSDLTELDLSGNPFSIIDHVTLVTIASLSKLEVLRMRSCELDEIPDKFLHTPRNLKTLDLSDNKLTIVPQELAETKNLVYLNLNQNPIQSLNMSDPSNPGFPDLENLKELHMCHMPSLISIDKGALSGLVKLEILHLSHNEKLSYLHPKMLAKPDETGTNDVWPSIKKIYLQDNNLTEIDSRLVKRWDTLDAIDVSFNPYLCDCSTQWMVDTLVEYIEKKSPNSSSNMICNEPIEMKEKTMKHLYENHKLMRCVDKYGHRPERDGSILLGTLIGVLLAVPIMLGLMLLWRHGYFSWIGLRGPQDTSRAFYKRAPAEDLYI